MASLILLTQYFDLDSKPAANSVTKQFVALTLASETWEPL